MESVYMRERVMTQNCKTIKWLAFESSKGLINMKTLHKKEKLLKMSNILISNIFQPYII